VVEAEDNYRVVVFVDLVTDAVFATVMGSMLARERRTKRIAYAPGFGRQPTVAKSMIPA